MKTMRMVATLWLISHVTFAHHPSAAQEVDRWWLQPQRMLQTNLREIDATMDLDRYVQEVKDFGANVVLFNVGGIVANYPTELQYHYRNPFMQGDLVGMVLDRLHAERIRVIGRFDFSKINEKFAAERPDWLYVSEKGQHVNYNGQVHTCVSGGYQQEYMFEILGEAIDRYPLDGVFFNMIGYQRSDYSGNYHGLCQCQACKDKFRDYAGMDLPKTQDDSPAYRTYVEFTRMMSDQQFNRVNAFLKRKRPDLAICTYTSTGVDIIRKESNRPLGSGTYHDTDKAKATLLTAGERQLANCAVHFIDIPFRHAAVSPYLTVRRIWQQMMGGAWLDFYCIGPLQRQEDRTGLDLTGELYRFHAANEQWLKQTKPAGEVGLVPRGDEEYDGLFQILCENHVAFELTRFEDPALTTYPLVIVPDADGLNKEQCRLLDRYVNEGGKLLLTGKIPQDLMCVGPVHFKQSRPAEKGSYIRIRAKDREQLGRADLEKLDLVFLNGPFHAYEAGSADVKGLLRLIPGDMFGPPEKCYYRHVSDYPGLLYRQHGRGAAACFPWGIGAHYEQQCHQGHASLMMGALDSLLGLDRRLRVTTSPLVEVTHRTGRGDTFEWVALFNHSGQRGKALHPPIPIRDIQIDLRPGKPVRSVRLLHEETELPVRHEGSRLSVTVPQLHHYEVILFEYAE